MPILELLLKLIDVVLHVDAYLNILVVSLGIFIYILLFLIIFAETGLVVTPFLPGDSLLFATGALAAQGSMHIGILFFILTAAALLGDTVNYWVGAYVGPRVFRENVRFVKREHVERTQQFYEKYGGKTIVIGRFLPIIRTFAPFVAGIATMNYARFLLFNILGGIAWVGLFLFAGYFFGNIPLVQENFSLVVIAIIILSLIPVVHELLKASFSSSLFSSSQAHSENSVKITQEKK